jgi:hypothetical protein
MIYQSQPIGLDNLWDLWTNEKKCLAVISIRGTTENLKAGYQTFMQLWFLLAGIAT